MFNRGRKPLRKGLPRLESGDQQTGTRQAFSQKSTQNHGVGALVDSKANHKKLMREV